MSNPREGREQDARAGTFSAAQAVASGGMVAVVGVILLASWILKAEPRPPAASPRAASAPANATAPPPPPVLAPLVGVGEDPPGPAPSMAPVAAPPGRARSSMVAQRASRDAERLARRSRSWTAQVAAICSEDSVAAVVRSTGDSERLYLLPVEIGDRSCYRILWGTYDGAAAAAAAPLPAPLAGKEKPRILPVAEVIR